MREEQKARNVLEVLNLPKVDLQAHKKKGGLNEDEIDQFEKLKFLRILNVNT